MNKKLLLIFSVVLLSANLCFAQRAKIVTEAVTPEKLILMGLTSTTNSVSTGLNVVGKGTYVYLSAKNIKNTDHVTSVEWSVISKPAGSTVTLNNMENNWVNFLADKSGKYEIKVHLSTAGGSHDTTTQIVAAEYVGTGGFEDVAPEFPNCMTCHQNHDKFVEIFNRWKVSGHANFFKKEITSGGAYYGTNCIKCHTTGYDHNIEADNNGFDDVAKQLGWNWDNYKPPKPGNWDTLETKFPKLVAFASIGCESCHGPGSQHTFTSDKKGTIQISSESGACAQCHDEPWRHNKVQEWEHSGHAEAIWSNSFAQSSGASYMSNSLGNCIRCHDGQGYINFTKGRKTDTKGMVSANLHMIGCATCHDPHGNENVASLRYSPAGSDTLATGETFTEGGTGRLCMDCHKARTNNRVMVAGTVSSAHWGPHASVQSDVLLGKNAAGSSSFASSPHALAVPDGCVGCHMSATTDTGTVTRDRVGGHSMKLHDEASNYDHTTSCVPCHGNKSKFSDFIAKADYDGNGKKESVQDEVKGLLKAVAMSLPPVGIDSISWSDIKTANDPKMKQAYWNYQLILNDGSYGMHNAQFAIDVLQKSLSTLTGVEPLYDVVATSFVLEQNYPNPFNPTTSIRFTLPEAGDVTLKIYDIVGNEVTTLHKGHLAAGSYNFTWNASNLASGVYFYKISAGKYNMVKKMVLMK